jgi:hypothetical protein
MKIQSLSLLTLLLISLFTAACGTVDNVTASCNQVTFTYTGATGDPPSIEFQVRDSGGRLLGSTSVTAPGDGVTVPVTVSFSATEGTVLILNAGLNELGSWTCGAPVTFDYDPMADYDGDGVINMDDNCINEFNPDQFDGYGSALGDACDSFYDTQTGIKGYADTNNPASQGFDVWGNCSGDACRLIATFNPLTVSDGARYQTADSGGWYVVVYYLGIDNGVDVYQVNTYNPTDTLMDDRLELLVANSSYTWRRR